VTDDARLWDVAVVGAGPAGASAARAAAEAGASVLLIDRATFPRYKTCAGGLVGASLANIPASVLAVVEDRPRRAVFTLRGARTLTVEDADPFLAMVDRQRFDAALVDAAVDAGAVFRGGVTLREVREGDGEVQLETTGGVLRARIVVGADGSASRVARYVGVRYRTTDLGLEDEIPIDPSPWSGSILIDWGPAPGSYAWLFPKEHTINVGVIQRTGDAAATRAFLADWKARLGVDRLSPSHSDGHLTRWREADSPLRRGRVIVAGDAAGLLEPWMREGISFGLRSGTWAGEVAEAAGADPERLDDYVRRVRDVLSPEQRAGALLRDLFERSPRLLQWGLGLAPARRFFVRYGRNQTTLARLYGPRGVMRTLELLARVTRSAGTRG
jgi:geranylgeranyl reductase family protein